MGSSGRVRRESFGSKLTKRRMNEKTEEAIFAFFTRKMVRNRPC